MISQKEWIKDVFNRVSPTYGEKGADFFNSFGEALVYYAALSEGEHVLDVATGKGAIAFPAAEAVGPGGRVVAIDISEGMIQEASKKNSCEWLEFCQMDAEALAFEDETFDVVFCGFGLFFFSNLSKALAEFKRVLKPGGCLVVSIWGKKTALDLWFAERAKALGASKRLLTMSLERPDMLTKVLEEAGFVEIETAEETKTFNQKDVATWWDSLISHGVRAAFDQLSLENQALLKEEAFQKVRQIGKIVEERQAYYAIAEKAELDA
jgi:ubiquinone/menaquinone biosynthesis C-methylase UbiE